MTFRDLYEYVLSLGRRPEFWELCERIKLQHPQVCEITVHEVEIQDGVALGYVVFFDRRLGLHEDADTLCAIRVGEHLDKTQTRFVSTKELMHAFDEPEEQVDDASRFKTLLKEFEHSTLREDVSPMLSSEWDAEWMAMAILCPKPLRDVAKAEWEADPGAAYEIALRCGIPEEYISNLFGDYYDRALETLLQRGIYEEPAPDVGEEARLVD